MVVSAAAVLSYTSSQAVFSLEPRKEFGEMVHNNPNKDKGYMWHTKNNITFFAKLYSPPMQWASRPLCWSFTKMIKRSFQPVSQSTMFIQSCICYPSNITTSRLLTTRIVKTCTFCHWWNCSILIAYCIQFWGVPVLGVTKKGRTLKIYSHKKY